MTQDTARNRGLPNIKRNNHSNYSNKYSSVMLLIVLYDGAMLRWMTWYTYCMLSAMNNGASNGNHRNDNNTTVSSSSLLDGAAAVAVASPWFHGYDVCTVPNRVQYGTTINNKSSSSPSLRVPGNWVPIGRRHFFPFSLPIFILVFVFESAIHLGSSIVVVSTSTVGTILTYTFLNKTAPLCHWAEACFNISSTLI